VIAMRGRADGAPFSAIDGATLARVAPFIARSLAFSTGTRAAAAPTEANDAFLMKLLTAAADIVSEVDIAALARAAEAKARALLAVERAHLVLFLENELRFDFVSDANFVRHEVAGFVGAVLSMPMPIRVVAPESDSRFCREVDCGDNVKLSSLLAVPVTSIGVLVLVNKQKAAFTESDESEALLLAGTVGIALKNALHVLSRSEGAEHDLELLAAGRDRSHPGLPRPNCRQRCDRAAGPGRRPLLRR
jgi:GAF domain-containing protein